MAVMTEYVGSRERRSGNNPEITREYIVQGTTDDSAVITEAESTAVEIAGLRRDSISIEPLHIDTVKDIGIWRVSVKYLSPEDAEPEAGDDHITIFSTGGATVNVTNAPSILNRREGAGALGNLTDIHKGTIGINGDAVDGVDIIFPQLEFSETHFIDYTDFTPAYLNNIFVLTGTQNNAAFREMVAGEVLFLGASGTRRGLTGVWELTFNFAASPNKSNIEIGDITLAEKRGWDYLWVTYRDEPVLGRLAKVPATAHVNRVYPEGDFSLLNIGV